MVASKSLINRELPVLESRRNSSNNIPAGAGLKRTGDNFFNK
jgi:hypothetical protein